MPHVTLRLPSPVKEAPCRALAALAAVAVSALWNGFAAAAAPGVQIDAQARTVTVQTARLAATFRDGMIVAVTNLGTGEVHADAAVADEAGVPSGLGHLTGMPEAARQTAQSVGDRHPEPADRPQSQVPDHAPAARRVGVDDGGHRGWRADDLDRAEQRHADVSRRDPDHFGVGRSGNRRTAVPRHGFESGGRRVRRSGTGRQSAPPAPRVRGQLRRQPVRQPRDTGADNPGRDAVLGGAGGRHRGTPGQPRAVGRGARVSPGLLLHELERQELFHCHRTFEPDAVRAAPEQSSPSLGGWMRSPAAGSPP